VIFHWDLLTIWELFWGLIRLPRHIFLKEPLPQNQECNMDLADW
jgi:hypothetical protein